MRVHGRVHAHLVRVAVRRQKSLRRSDVRDLPRDHGESAKSARPARRGAATREPGPLGVPGSQRRVRGRHQARATPDRAAATRRRRRRRKRRGVPTPRRRRANGRVRVGKQESVRVGPVDTHQAADRCGVGTCFRKRPSRFLFCHSFSRTETPVSIDFIPNAFRRSFRRPRRFSLSLFAFRFSLFAASTVSAASSHSSSTTIKKKRRRRRSDKRPSSR